jgi:hypothetical protein
MLESEMGAQLCIMSHIGQWVLLNRVLIWKANIMEKSQQKFCKNIAHQQCSVEKQYTEE